MRFASLTYVLATLTIAAVVSYVSHQPYYPLVAESAVIKEY